MSEWRSKADYHRLAMQERGSKHRRWIVGQCSEAEGKDTGRAGYVEGGVWSLTLHFRS